MTTTDTLAPTNTLAAVPPVRWSLTRFLPLTAGRRRPVTARNRPTLPCPRRFGDSYLWPDGSWTHSG